MDMEILKELSQLNTKQTIIIIVGFAWAIGSVILLMLTAFKVFYNRLETQNSKIAFLENWRGTATTKIENIEAEMDGFHVDLEQLRGVTKSIEIVCARIEVGINTSLQNHKDFMQKVNQLENIIMRSVSERIIKS